MNKKIMKTAGLVPVIASLFAAPAVMAQDHDLSVTFRTHYGQVDRHFGPEDSEEMSQAIRLDYRSPYFNDVIGFDGSLYAVLKLHAAKNTARIPLLDEDGDGFSKLGQANVKLKLGEDWHLRAGRMRIVSPLMTDTDGRSEPSTRRAVRLDGSIAGAKVYGIYSDEVSTTGENTFKEYTQDGDGVMILGGSYNFENGLGLMLSHGQLEDAKRQTFFNASYGMPLGDGKLLFDAYHYMAKEIGDGSNLADNPGPDGELDTYLSNLAVSYKQGDLKYTLSWQTVGDDLYEPSWDGFNNDRSVLWSWNSVQILDFYNPNQDSWQARVDYNSSAVPGLSMMGRYTEGDYTQGGVNYEDSEFDFETKYVLQTGPLKDLSFQLRYADVEIGGAGDLEDIRLIAEYTKAFF
ncbi:OprD family outer membrane porin [Marinobacterium maritimum]